MNKYNSKVVFDYINGNEIIDYNIDELEDDYKFMMMVINYTNDKNMYNLCSDKVKTNYEFVKYIINKFKDELSFISGVADYFLENNKDDLKELEIVIIMHNLTKNKIKEFNKYKVLTDANYSTKLVELELIRQTYKDDEEVIDEMQMGFWFIIDNYNFSDIPDLEKIQRIINLSVEHNKKIALIGIKAQRIVNIAVTSGYLNVPEANFVNLKYLDENNKNDDKDLVVIVTGTRHEPFYMLQRMCKKIDRLIEIHENDVVIMVTPPVPGTERMAARTVDALLRSKANVMELKKSMLKSSHADSEDLKKLPPDNSLMEDVKSS